MTETRGVNHAQIRSLGYDAERKVLDVRFRNVGHYEYADVPAELARDLFDLIDDGNLAQAVFVFDRKVEGSFKSTRVGD